MSGIIGGRAPSTNVMTKVKDLQTTKTQDMAQDVQAAKKKKKPGQSSLIETTSMGLGGDAPTYKPTLLS
tara:strand:+ start:1379 stop:1585 length:207 start_codon:yes stop_codon:yes gene_type:complete